MQLFLVRHGRTIANNHPGDYPWDNDCPLTTSGKREAMRTARFLKQLQLSNPYIISSPLLRAQQTATILAQAMATPVRTDLRLTEGNVGIWHNESDEQAYDNFLKLPLGERYTFTPPESESWEQSGKRLTSVVQDNHEKAVLMLISHFEPLLAGTGTLLQTSFATWATYDFPNASITLLHDNGSSWQADYIGQVPR